MYFVLMLPCVANMCELLRPSGGSERIVATVVVLQSRFGQES